MYRKKSGNTAQCEGLLTKLNLTGWNQGAEEVLANT